MRKKSIEKTQKTVSRYHKYQEDMVIKTTHTKNVITMQIYTKYMQYE